MNVKINDLMTREVIVAQPHHTVAHLRNLMQKNHLHAVPIVASDGSLVGIVSNTDLAADLKDGTPAKSIMTEKVYTIPAYNDVHHAARLMRNHQCHHVVVTHEQEVVGMLSSFDLLELVEEHRFVMKPAPKTSRARRQ